MKVKVKSNTPYVFSGESPGQVRAAEGCHYTAANYQTGEVRKKTHGGAHSRTRKCTKSARLPTLKPSHMNGNMFDFSVSDEHIETAINVYPHGP